MSNTPSSTSDSPSSNEDRVRSMYSAIRYPNLDPRQNDIYVRHRKFVYDKLGIDISNFFRDKTLLDAGCGTGEETMFLASLGPERIVGIDTSQGSLELARASAKRSGLENVEFRYGSVLDRSQFAPASFDYVSSLGCIHHTPDTVRAFRNLCHWVKPRGHLCTFIYNTYGHLVYNIECGVLDLLAGSEVEKRVGLARRLFDCAKTFEREGISCSYDGRLYDKYGVLYRDSMTLRRLLSLYAEEGFQHMGSFPMYMDDILEAARARTPDGSWPPGARGTAARIASKLTRKSSSRRRWTRMRRFSMQALLLVMGLYDYGSAFRILGVKGNDNR